jgi:hypothetical protein
MGFIEDQRSKALEWLEAIKGDVQALVIHNHIFWEIQSRIHPVSFTNGSPKCSRTPLSLAFAGRQIVAPTPSRCSG